MTSFDKTDVNCPVCDTRFEIPILTSTNTFGGQTTDFHARAAGADPLQFMIGTCPTCGYSDFSGKLMEPIEVSDIVKEKVREELTPLINGKKPDPATSFEFAAKIAHWQHQPSINIGLLYLQAAWCCQEYGNNPNEATYRLTAIDVFKKALSEDKLTTERRLNTIYLIGELYRRVNNLEKAAEWFNQAIQECNKTDEPHAAKIKKIAIQQRDNPKEIFGE